MEIFFSPLACSMASRITLYEAGATATFIQVDARAKRTSSGLDYHTINPLGLVPALRLPSGELLLENAAILQFLADLHPDAALVPRAGFERSVLQQWLSFIGTELHKALFIPLFDKTQSEAAREKTLMAGAKRLALLQAHLAQRKFLLDAWSVADAYLTTVAQLARHHGHRPCALAGGAGLLRGHVRAACHREGDGRGAPVALRECELNIDAGGRSADVHTRSPGAFR